MVGDQASVFALFYGAGITVGLYMEENSPGQREKLMLEKEKEVTGAAPLSKRERVRPSAQVSDLG